MEKDKFENVQKYFYGSLKEFGGEVYAVDQFRIYVDFEKKRLQAEQDLMLFGNLMEEI